MIYICIPAHNEEQTVGVVLWKIRQVMTDFPRDYQILVADDASTDATASVLEPYARVLPLTIFRNPDRRGYAASLEMLLRAAVERAPYAKRDAIVTLQADFTDDPQDLVALVKLIEAGADLVTGNRVLQGEVPPKLRWAHRALAWSARRTHVPAAAGDPLSSYRAYRVHTLRKAFEQVTPRRLLTCDGPAANAQLLAACAPHARRVESIDVALRTERLQRDSRFVGWETFKQLVQLVRNRAPRGDDARTIAPAEQAQHSRDGIYFDGDELAAAGARHRGNGRGERERNGRGERERNGRGGRERDPRGRGDSARPPRRESGAPAAAGRDEARPARQARVGAEARAERPARGRAGEPRQPRAGQPGEAAGGGAGGAADTRVEAPDGVVEPIGTDQTVVPGAAGTGEGDEAATPKRRRSRRGGRGRKRSGAAAADAGEQGESGVGEGGVDDNGGESPRGRGAAQPAGEQGEAEGGDGLAEGQAKRRRSRRGSRGGRRRRGAQQGAGSAGGEGGEAAGADGGAPPGESAGSGADVPRHERKAPAAMRAADGHEAARGDAS